MCGCVALVGVEPASEAMSSPATAAKAFGAFRQFATYADRKPVGQHPHGSRGDSQRFGEALFRIFNVSGNGVDRTTPLRREG